MRRSAARSPYGPFAGARLEAALDELTQRSREHARAVLESEVRS